MRKKLQSYFSMLGRSFLLAVAAMSFFVLLLSLGAVLKNPFFIEAVPFLGNTWVQFIANALSESGLVIIRFMPLVFAVSIAIGMSEKGSKEIAAFSAVVGYLFMITFSSLAMSTFGLALKPDVVVGENNMLAISQTLEMRKAMQTMVLGVQTIDTGVLGGVIVGTVSAWATKRFKTQSLPMIFSFYRGKHFPPIATGFIFMVVGIVIPFIWPVIGGGIYSAAKLVTGAGVFGSFLFGFIERMLIPTGLHHVWYSLAHFTPVGGTKEICGQFYTGTKAITTAALGCGKFSGDLSDITRVWLGQGATPIKVFGVPGALLGIYLAAKNKNRAKVIAISAASASFFAGVTEPFEFLFMFLAPGLFVIHAALTGLSFAILDLVNASYLGGNNIIELIFNGVFQGHKSTWIPVTLVGVAMFFIYMFTFKWYIEKFNIMTPGREPEEDTEEILHAEVAASKLIISKADKNEVAKILIEHLGGKDNIKDYTNCISRLRIFVHDPSLLNEGALKKVPDSLGMSKPSEEEVHIVFGMKVSEYREALDVQLDQ
ncbi:PTS transporter subunit EIIC [Fictibacillus sp. WQ 8-8]|uniref:PTS transporter subunit EIIC n=1 Tax=Fictibacillus TaxID=1329200 RepID=UPI00210B1B31|nr:MULTISPECIES: PTS transporter subunit EIIC [Fictibacillus]MCQ6266774.1 PTS transporter subunit EIIC [Fictibacillus sp. WQ 8-8]WHY71226.1 PTS transporter subunit EIIC [Fictibacillus enclensis]